MYILNHITVSYTKTFCQQKVNKLSFKVHVPKFVYTNCDLVRFLIFSRHSEHQISDERMDATYYHVCLPFSLFEENNHKNTCSSF
jgi:hypothetical protein